ncbi:GrpB family protein [Shewanella algae]|uniref:GrpB family protein n=1 Tax=Shewanella algae TaxID=38313 RepID=UPI002231D793|nr:GrpB family protein [Shewanella algae]UZD56645.1 GrpB family protein [Shewanella algae]
MNKQELIIELERLNIGLKRFTVSHEKYNDSWAEAFRLVLEFIKPCIKDCEVIHIGSTAIPGSIAKPILDIVITFEHSSGFISETKCLERLGFTSKGAYGVKGREFFTFYNRELTYDYIHIHAFPDSHPKKIAHIEFLNAHLANSSLVEEYNALKQGLVKQGISREDYPEAKTSYVEKVLSGITRSK